MGEFKAARTPDQIITWSNYEVDKREVCSALGIPVSGTAGVDIQLSVKGIEITVKSQG